MAMETSEKHELMMIKCKLFYVFYKKEYNLEGKSEKEQLNILIDKACEIQGIINDENDKIVIEGLNKAQAILTIDKSTWVEFIKIVQKKMYGELSDKEIDKLNNSIDIKKYMISLRESLIRSYLSNNTIKIIDENSDLNTLYKKIESPDFTSLVENCAKIKQEINRWNRTMGSIQQAAYFATDGKIDKSKFYKLKDYKFNLENDPEKVNKVKKIYDNFIKTYKLLNLYNSEYCDKLNEEFGLEIKLHKIDDDEC